jgi:hypothetical protein
MSGGWNMIWKNIIYKMKYIKKFESEDTENVKIGDLVKFTVDMNNED